MGETGRWTSDAALAKHLAASIMPLGDRAECDEWTSSKAVQVFAEVKAGRTSLLPGRRAEVESDRKTRGEARAERETPKRELDQTHTE